MPNIIPPPDPSTARPEIAPPDGWEDPDLGTEELPLAPEDRPALTEPEATLQAVCELAGRMHYWTIESGSPDRLDRVRELVAELRAVLGLPDLASMPASVAAAVLAGIESTAGPGQDATSAVLRGQK